MGFLGHRERRLVLEVDWIYSYWIAGGGGTNQLPTTANPNPSPDPDPNPNPGPNHIPDPKPTGWKDGSSANQGAVAPQLAAQPASGQARQ